MKNKEHRIPKTLLIILFAAVGIGCFFAGKLYERTPVRKEREFNILLNRSELEVLGEIDGKIHVTGHKNPDADSVCGSIAYANLLQKLGYDAVPAVLGKTDANTAHILESAGVDVPPLLLDATGLNMVLVDHSDYSQSADGLDEANVICIIDHHGDGTVTTGNQMIYDSRPFGAAATIIWMKYRDYGVEIDKKTAFILLGAVLSDTLNLKNSATSSADREAVKELARIAGISDVNAYYSDLYKAAISYTNMTDEEIFLNDYKEYEVSGVKFAIGCINAYDDDGASAMAERIKNIVAGMPEKKGMDIAFAQINILHDDLSKTYIIPSDDTADEIIKSALPGLAEFDGTSYIIEPGISRKKELVPAITEVLKKSYEKLPR